MTFCSTGDGFRNGLPENTFERVRWQSFELQRLFLQLFCELGIVGPPFCHMHGIFMLQCQWYALWKLQLAA